MKVFIITDSEGRMISAWPKIGVAKIHCRKELDDRIVDGYFLVIEKPAKRKPAKNAKKGSKHGK